MAWQTTCVSTTEYVNERLTKTNYHAKKFEKHKFDKHLTWPTINDAFNNSQMKDYFLNSFRG